MVLRYSMVLPFTMVISTLNVLETAMGIKINAQSEPNLKYAAKVRKMGDIFMARAVSPWKFIDFFYRLTADYREEKKATHYMHEFTNEIIRNRKSEYLKEKMVSSANKTFIDLLLQTQTDGNSLTDECIRDEVNTFMFAGHDTTASALCYTIYLLAKHPEAQVSTLLYSSISILIHSFSKKFKIRILDFNKTYNNV